MRTFIWRIVDFCDIGLVFFPVAAVLKALLIQSCPSMRAADRKQKRWLMLATGVVGILALMFVVFFRLDGYQFETKATIYYLWLMLYGCLYLFYQSLMDSWTEEMAEFISNELFGINN